MISIMRRFPLARLFILAAVFSFFMPTHANAKTSILKYPNCIKLQMVWPHGVAISSARAKLQAIKPSVNTAGYKKNSHLDTDRDGTACEVKKSTVQTVPNVPTPSTTSTTTTTIPLVCPNSSNVVVEIQSASDGNLRTVPSGNTTYLYYMRNVQGVIRNNSGVRIQILNFSLSGNLLSDNLIIRSQTVSVMNNVNIEPGRQYGWSKSYEALASTTRSLVLRNETVETFTFESVDSRCP